ncbi:proteasome accessory factor PafA2 family protein [Actinomyces weissii]|uniref:Proteasome accessory factor PafA2 family protein n=1 Tax=Actinomyces weissii TaxID=675090 RepID=A0A7T7M831_9ACTO|nr:proteasome accessory factor PafA2 family protein [Actinomyces weissii]QQM66605.1 proteasome accessory factor PafA2 family protein [Actinomyces weissii]
MRQVPADGCLIGPTTRPVGLETELGVLEPGNLYANPVVLASRLVDAYAAVSRPAPPAGGSGSWPPVRWDYEAEDPLADLRGGHLDRAAAHPSLLTDDPTAPAPSGEEPSLPDGVALLPAAAGASDSGTRTPGPSAAGPVLAGHRVPAPAVAGTSQPQAASFQAGTGVPTGHRGSVGAAPGQDLADLPPGPWGARPRPTVAEAALARATTAVLGNGARFYVDHAHPEYSSPEVLTPLDALVWDRAGEVVAQRAMAALAAQADGPQTVLYKNNVDGKGATYGSHENYLVRRQLPFTGLSAALVPFLLTRPVLVGAGRVGLGQRSQEPGFQISQRADYVCCELGLQTTFNRPVVNTRDEPHADAARWRRLHVINGDANMFDVPGYLKVATTNLLLWLLERAHDRGQDLGPLTGLRVRGDLAEQHWAMSHDTTLSFRYDTERGPLSALQVQRLHLEAVRAALLEDFGGTDAAQVGEETSRALRLWAQVLGLLDRLAAAQQPGSRPEQRAAAVEQAAPLVEWVAKMQLCEALIGRHGCGWADPRVAALDLQWADLREGRGVAQRLRATGRAHRLTTDAQVRRAADQPPAGTRAAVRGRAVARFPQVVAASWTSLVLDLPQHPCLVRLSLPPEVRCDEKQAQALLEAISQAATSGGD